MKKITLYEYSDYRKYLHDYYLSQKEKGAHGFSYRIFSERAGLRSPNYFKMVMEGSRNLSLKMIHRFAKALKLDQRQQAFFEALVQFNQSTDPEEKDFYFRKMITFREYRQSTQLVVDQYEYLSRWYYVAIREMLALEDFNPDPKEIAYRLNPPIHERQAEEALKLLLQLGLITKGSRGKLKQKESKLATEETIASIAAFNYHRQMIRLGMEALSESAELREISAITMALPMAELPNLKKKVFQFLMDLQNWLDEIPQSSKEIYQLNFQLFPLTKVKLEKGSVRL